MHGNELRKAEHVAAAISRLRRAVALSINSQTRATASAMLARAAGEAGRAELFDDAIDCYRRQLDHAGDQGMFGNRFTFREIHLRGLVATGRAEQAARLMDEPYGAAPAAPQWRVIEHVTTGEILLAVGDRAGAEQSLLAAVVGAETYRLPHQIQRTVRLAEDQLDTVAEIGRSALERLDRQLASPP